jgi:hypothetical protein
MCHVLTFEAVLWFYDGDGDRCPRTFLFFELGLVNFDGQSQVLVGPDKLGDALW